MKIHLNGEAHDVQAGTVAALLTELNLPSHALLIEHNGTALHRSEWGTALNESDRLEFIRIVAGG